MNINCRKGPCKDCTTDRHLGCHNTCEKYKEWLNDIHSVKKKIQQERLKGAKRSAICMTHTSNIFKGKNTVK